MNYVKTFLPFFSWWLPTLHHITDLRLQLPLGMVRPRVLAAGSPLLLPRPAQRVGLRLQQLVQRLPDCVPGHALQMRLNPALVDPNHLAQILDLAIRLRRLHYWAAPYPGPWRTLQVTDEPTRGLPVNFQKVRNLSYVIGKDIVYQKRGQIKNR